MAVLFLDTETFCETPISHGTHAYAEAAEVMLAPYAWDDEPVACLDFTAGDRLEAVQALIDEADVVVVHNSAFDRTVLRHNDIDLPVRKVHDTMVQALSHSLPGSLGTLCDILKVPVDKAKDKAGKSLIHTFCKPLGKNRKLRRATRETHPAEWETFKAYACSDVEAMREVYKRLPKWNYAGPRSNSRRDELELWWLDQEINDRGIAVDIELASAALRAAARAQKLLAERAFEVSEGAVGSATQRDKVIAFLAQAHGYQVADLKGGSVDRMLEALDLVPEVREMLEIRQEAAATSPAKYAALLRGVSEDGRLRGTIQFCGASRTGRDAGRLFQPQNLPRPTLKQKEIEDGIAAMKADCEDLVVDNVMELCTSAVRGCLVAAEGKKLVIADLSNIEGRVLAWLAGEEWKLQAFRDYDAGIGHDLYKLTAAGILNKKPEDITPEERQVSGKVPELACGYQGALGAFKTMGALYGVDLPDTTIMQIVKAYRATNAKIAAFWVALERACRLAADNPGSTHRVGLLAVQRDGAWLRIRLPSGRYLCYAAAVSDENGKMSYMGINQYTRKWERLKTYGGKLVENVTQAVARDVMMAGVTLAEANGYPVVLRVHDELICETPDTESFTVKALAAMMSTNPPWAKGLPLAAAGFECKRYRKG